MKPAPNPTAIAAPIFWHVPAIGPYRIAPINVPIKDSLIPIFDLLFRMMDQAYVEITLALRAKNVLMNAYCQM